MEQQLTPALPFGWEVLMRYRLIEIIALWEGRLTTNHQARFEYPEDECWSTSILVLAAITARLSK